MYEQKPTPKIPMTVSPKTFSGRVLPNLLQSTHPREAKNKVMQPVHRYFMCVPFLKKAYNPSRVIGESSVVRVFGLDSVCLVKVVVLKLFGFLDLRYRTDRHQSQSGACCKHSGSSNELGSVPLDSGDESVLVELELENLVVGLDGGVVGVHGGSFRVEGSHYSHSFLRESLYPKLMGYGLD
nr:MAG TPA: hypothetical protein [Caudoviricetes sp.]